MLSRGLLVSVFGALLACGGSQRGGAAVGNSGSTGTLAAALRAEVGHGAQVAIVPGPSGLRAVSADGTHTRVLVEGAVPWALVDNTLDVVWFGNPDRTEIRMIDLTAANSTPVKVEVVVAGLPTAVNPGGPEFGIAHGEAPSGEEGSFGLFAELSYSRSILPEAVLLVGPDPQLHGVGGILEMWGDTAEFDAALAKATMPGRDRLIALAKRTKPYAIPPEPVPVGRVAEVSPDNCEDAERCGEAEAVPGTKLWRVVVSFACGDGCYTEWRLYDPARKVMLDGDWAQWIAAAQIAPDGSAFVRDGVVARFDGGPVAATPVSEEDMASGGGWIDGGPWVGR